MSLDLYYLPMSAPCRAVLLTIEALGLSVNLKEIDLLGGEHLQPEYEQYPVVFYGAETYDDEQYENLRGSFDLLDRFLDNQDYLAGRSLTLADLALISTVTTAEALGFDVLKYKYVSKWMDKIKSSAPGYRKANAEGLEILKKFVADRMSQ
ncbi:hypothetical protein M0804_007639 [Polistes exclamans]|nr:hypothetical protein M0804_007639 [Polistes exclamans]